MPSMKWFGVQWHAPTDMIPFIATSQLILNTAWLILYIVLLFAITRYHNCPPSEQHHAAAHAISWGILAFLCVNIITAIALIILGCQGTPLTPSTRHLVPYLLYFDFFKYLSMLGFLIWSIVFVTDNHTSPSCWDSERRRNVEIVVWCTFTVIILLFVIIVSSYNMLGSKSPQSRWKLRVKIVSKLLGCYDLIKIARMPALGLDDDLHHHRNSGNSHDRDDDLHSHDHEQDDASVTEYTYPIEEISTYLARMYGSIDLEKSDIVVGLALTSVMQSHHRRDIIADRLIKQHVQLSTIYNRRDGNGKYRDDIEYVETRQDEGVERKDTSKVGVAMTTACTVDDGGVDSSLVCLPLADTNSSAPGSRTPLPSWPRPPPPPSPTVVPTPKKEEGFKTTPSGRKNVFQHTMDSLQHRDVEQGLVHDNEGSADSEKKGRHSYTTADAYKNCTTINSGSSCTSRIPSEAVEAPSMPPAAALAPSAIDDDKALVSEWMKAVSKGNDVLITPSNWGGKLAPHLKNKERAALYTDAGCEVEVDVLEEALYWAKHAIAAYGKTAYTWLEKMIHGTRYLLFDLTLLYILYDDPCDGGDIAEYTSSICIKTPLQCSFITIRLNLLIAKIKKIKQLHKVPEPLQSKLREDHKVIEHFVGGQMITGIPDEDVMYASWANQPLGTTPYFIVRDTPHRTVVLSIRGTASYADLVTDLIHQPVDITAWLPSSFARTHNLVEVKAHSGIMAAAQAVLNDLNRHQILHTLLMGYPREESAEDAQSYARCFESNGDGARSSSQDTHRTQKEYQEIFQKRDVDCRGWNLVVTGHSLGAAIAALLSVQFVSWYNPSSITVWCFDPPGGLVTENLSLAMRSFVTSVIVGKDVISRTSTVTFEMLQDQLVVALARCRLSKCKVLMHLTSRSLRNAPTTEVFYAVDDVPEEALGYVWLYFVSKRGYIHDVVPMIPPGRAFFLRRLKPWIMTAAVHQERKKGSWVHRVGTLFWKQGSSTSEGQHPEQQRWQAVWIHPRQIIEEGILLSNHQASDHYSQRLLGVLSHIIEYEKRRSAGCCEYGLGSV